MSTLRTVTYSKAQNDLLSEAIVQSNDALSLSSHVFGATVAKCT